MNNLHHILDIPSQPTEFDFENFDWEDFLHCQSSYDCPSGAICPSGKNITLKNMCVCIDELYPLKKNKTCSQEILSDAHGKIDLGGKFGKVMPDPSLTLTGSPEQNQTTSMAKEDNPFLDQSMALKIFIPLAVFIVVSVILTVVLLRYFRFCSRNRKRNKNTVVKASEDIQLLDRMNMVHKNPTYFGTSLNVLSGKKVHIIHIPIERVKLLDAVGEGAFGQVFKGEMTPHANPHVTRYMYRLPTRTPYQRELCMADSDEKKQIAVKVLKEGVSNEAREDFEREVDIMSAFDHDNILKLLGIVTANSGDTPYMIFEYMVHGDLAELLRKNDPSIRGSNSGYKLQKNDLIDITTQIANGMKYLTQQHFVHRDLATRNCLVGEGLIVKISDFGMARDIYTCDYYRIGGSRMLPVRWMSPESVKWGRFTTESDIWAFGVVLWEIFNYGRQPYYGHSNEEVIRFLDEGILLQRPDECPSTVYHVMLGCWKLDPKERMHFSRIHKYLEEYSKQSSRSNHTNSVDFENDYEIPV